MSEVIEDELDVRVRRALWRILAKVMLGLISVVALGSWGGQMLLPILLPAYLWAARSSGRAGRVLWSLPFGIGFGVMVWALVYTQVGESQPAIWLIPLLVTAVAAGALWRAAGPPPSEP